jgi:hypothetical protein
VRATLAGAAAEVRRVSASMAMILVAAWGNGIEIASVIREGQLL